MMFHTLFASPAMKTAHLGAGFEGSANSGLDQLTEVLRLMRVSQEIQRRLPRKETI